MKKKITMLLLLIICSGCSNIKYSLKFDNEIQEYITFTDETHIEENLPADYMTDMSPIEYMFQSLPYNSGSDKSGNYFAGTFYDDVNDIMDSLIFKYISSDSIVINNKKVKINISKEKIYNVNSLDGLEISMYIPYYVSNHNADKVEKNTYTWNITDFENEKVKITFDMSKPADFKNKIIEYCVIGIIVIAIICAIIYFVSKNKKVNKI